VGVAAILQDNEWKPNERVENEQKMKREGKEEEKEKRISPQQPRLEFQGPYNRNSKEVPSIRTSLTLFAFLFLERDSLLSTIFRVRVYGSGNVANGNPPLTKQVLILVLNDPQEGFFACSPGISSSQGREA